MRQKHGENESQKHSLLRWGKNTKALVERERQIREKGHVRRKRGQRRKRRCVQEAACRRQGAEFPSGPDTIVGQDKCEQEEMDVAGVRTGRYGISL